MKAYQMIYTACGQDRSGAFSVWSKSVNVTKAECDEIVKLLSYKRPPNAPYEPTEKEIRTLFPPKYAYILLSSGRRCVAKASYIGKVYSDLDTRNGNFIIHAYLFDDAGEFDPFFLEAMTSFRSSLTYAEWHDNPPPAELPAVDLPAHSAISTDVLRRYTTGEAGKKAASLLQACLNCPNTDKTVTFNATEREQLDWYAVIGTLLPLPILKDLTYSTQYSPQVEYSVTGFTPAMVRIRNIFAAALSSFSFQDEQSLGRYAFNFAQNICPQVPAGRYVTDILQAAATCGVFDVMKRVETVGKVMAASSCDADTATGVYYLMQKCPSWFTDAGEYRRALDIGRKYRLIDEQGVAAGLYRGIIATGKWGKGSQIADLVAFAYQNSDETVREAIMDGYFADLAVYGADLSAAPEKLFAQVRSNAPFAWDDFVAACVRSPKWGRYVAANDAANKLFVLFDAAVDALSHNYGKAENERGYALLEKIIAKSVARRAVDEIAMYLKCVARIGEAFVDCLVEAAMKNYLSAALRDETSVDFALNVCCAVPHEQERAKLVQMIVMNNLRSAFFIPLYIRCQQQYPAVFAVAERALKRDTQFADFLFRKDAYVFSTATDIRYEALADYFEKYYKIGYDGGIFVRQVQNYLDRSEGKKRVDEVLRIYTLVKDMPDSYADMPVILETLFGALTKMPMQFLLDHAASRIADITPIADRLQRTGRNVPGEYFDFITILLMRKKFGMDALKQAIASRTLYAALDKRRFEDFVAKYLGEAVRMHLDCRRAKICEKSALVEAVFVPILSAASGKVHLTTALEEYSRKEYYQLMADLMAYAFNASGTGASDIRKYVQNYVGSMKRGAYKKLFKKVPEFMTEAEAASVRRYTDDFLADHMSFLEKLFSKKK